MESLVLLSLLGCPAGLLKISPVFVRERVCVSEW
jgi:hypothetical protein